MGLALCRHAGGGRRRGFALALSLAVAAVSSTATAQLPLGMERFDGGRFTVAAASRDAALARSLLAAAQSRDTFPWLPRPTARVLVIVAPDRQRFAELVGPYAPEYGAAIAMPAEQRIVMQGSRAGSDAGNPLQVLRHELAHLALHEAMGDLPPRWFDEGYASYAAGEWGREEVLATNLALALRGAPSLEALDRAFSGGSASAAGAYALAHRAIVEMAAMDPERGLSLLFSYWRQSGELDPAIRRAYQVTLGDFETRWRQRTRRRYGALALFADLTVGAVVLVLVLVPLHLARRKRNRERLERLRAAESAAERRERESAVEALLRSVSPPAQRGDEQQS